MQCFRRIATRDLLWLVVAVAIGLSWSQEGLRRREAETRADAVAGSIRAQQSHNEGLRARLNPKNRAWERRANAILSQPESMDTQ